MLYQLHSHSKFEKYAESSVLGQHGKRKPVLRYHSRALRISIWLVSDDLTSRGSSYYCRLLCLASLDEHFQLEKTRSKSGQVGDVLGLYPRQRWYNVQSAPLKLLHQLQYPQFTTLSSPPSVHHQILWQLLSYLDSTRCG